ncbi:MAG TPA: hypothetical protein VIM11_09285 [Tepidisphaeraceae bacterium]|jgi:predicted protein tyrosine phosphatase
MHFLVQDRNSIEHGIRVRSSYVVISIRDPDKRKVRIRKQAGLRDSLHLAFHDAEPAGNMVLPHDITLMTAEHAKEIWQFVRKWDGKVGAVVVHCEQGMSRSPAVAAALCKTFGGDESPFFRDYQPNRYVYRLMLGSWSEAGETGG